MIRRKVKQCVSSMDTIMTWLAEAGVEHEKANSVHTTHIQAMIAGGREYQKALERLLSLL